MKKFSLKLLLSVSLMVFGVAVSAQALPLSLPSNSPIYFHFDNMEQVDQSGTNSIVIDGGYNGSATQGNWGLFNISSVHNGGILNPVHSDISGGPGFFLDDGPGGTNGQITGIFYGINLTSGTTATGGYMDIYWNDAGSDSVTAAMLAGSSGGPNAATVSLFTTGTKLARYQFSSGIEDGNTTTFIKSNSDLTTTQGLSGHSDSFLDLVLGWGGAWENQLDGNWFWTDEDGDAIRGEAGERHDLRLSTFFNAMTDWDGSGSIKGLRSNDPGRLFTVVPEPTSILLLGVGLLGFAGALRRKSN